MTKDLPPYEEDLKKSHRISTLVVFTGSIVFIILGFLSLKGWEEILEPIGLHVLMKEWSWFISGLYKEEHQVIYS